MIGKNAQRKLENSKVSIVGIGATGTAVLEILARAGIGSIKIIDRDVVELGNLHRQNLFTEEDINKPKAMAAKERIIQINSEINVESFVTDLDFDNISILDCSNIILDCTDNIYTRFLINDFSRKYNVPWVYASVIGTKGMVINITPETQCFSCIFKEPDSPLDTCDTVGILNTAPQAISAVQVTEALKILTGNEYCRDLISYDLWVNQLDRIKVKKINNCRTCNGVYDYLNGLKARKTIKICGSSSFQIKLENIDMEMLFYKLSKLKPISAGDECLIFRDIILFKSGRALVKADSKEKAKIALDKYLG